jgi:hypothetical protein
MLAPEICKLHCLHRVLVIFPQVKRNSSANLDNIFCVRLTLYAAIQAFMLKKLPTCKARKTIFILLHIIIKTKQDFIEIL